MGNEIIRIEHLRKDFGSRCVLKDINFTVKPKEVVCIIGSSGSGKSTLLRCINLLERPTSGEILYHDQDITTGKMSLAKLRSKVGMVFQQFNLFNNLNVLKNCEVGQIEVLKRKKEEAKEIAINIINLYRHVRNRLSPVHQQCNVLLATNLGDLFYGLHRSKNVGEMTY